ERGRTPFDPVAGFEGFPVSRTRTGTPTMADILIADDNVCTRKALANLLCLQGHRVRCAADGAEAMRLLDEETPGVLVLDLTMPGMDGLAVLRHLRAGPTT